LWDAPTPMTDSAAGLPFTEINVPGRDISLQLLLERGADGVGVLLVLPFRVVGENPDGTPVVQGLEPIALTQGESDTPGGTDFSVELRGFSEFTLLIAKKDPGQGIVWTAFGFLIVGLMISFWMPRRRIWARVEEGGRVSLVARTDRYVDLDREFGGLLDELVAKRRAAPG